jgi:acyl-CoA thioesterase
VAVGVDEWWWFECRTVSAGAGYASVRGEIYGPDGRMAADFSQLVAVFG